jgi:transcription elongation factor Elf1
MPLDHYDDEDEMKKEAGPRTGHKDFDCPSCNANNPSDEPLEDGAEVLCNYCGTEFKVTVLDNGRLKFREV